MVFVFSLGASCSDWFPVTEWVWTHTAISHHHAIEFTDQLRKLFVDLDPRPSLYNFATTVEDWIWSSWQVLPLCRKECHDVIICSLLVTRYIDKQSDTCLTHFARCQHFPLSGMECALHLFLDWVTSAVWPPCTMVSLLNWNILFVKFVKNWKTSNGWWAEQQYIFNPCVQVWKCLPANTFFSNVLWLPRFWQ